MSGRRKRKRGRRNTWRETHHGRPAARRHSHVKVEVGDTFKIRSDRCHQGLESSFSEPPRAIELQLWKRAEPPSNEVRRMSAASDDAATKVSIGFFQFFRLEQSDEFVVIPGAGSVRTPILHSEGGRCAGPRPVARPRTQFDGRREIPSVSALPHGHRLHLPEKASCNSTVVARTNMRTFTAFGLNPRGEPSARRGRGGREHRTSNVEAKRYSVQPFKEVQNRLDGE